jgi:hypothetical protein
MEALWLDDGEQQPQRLGPARQHEAGRAVLQALELADLAGRQTNPIIQFQLAQAEGNPPPGQAGDDGGPAVGFARHSRLVEHRDPLL